MLATVGRIALILVLALVSSRVGRGAIDRFTRRMRGEIAEGRFDRLRRRRLRWRSSSAAGDDGDDGGVTIDLTSPLATLRAAQRAETIGTLLKSVVSLGVWAIAALMTLSAVGLDVGPLVAGAGFVGIALGFGAQNLVRDFLSGIFMLIEDQYGVGDVVDAGPATGTVEAVSLRTTRLRDINGVVWHIPNGTIDRIGNKSQGWSRALVDVSVAYSTDIEQARKVIESCAATMTDDPSWSLELLDSPEVWGVEDLGPDGVVVRVSVKTRPASQWRVARELRERLKAALESAGIEIPFPQRVIWHRSVAGGGGAGGGSRGDGVDGVIGPTD